MADINKDRALNVAIVGGGIAGLTTAIALRTHGRRKHQVMIFEKRSECRSPFSGPVQLSPNATGILARFGVSSAIESCLPDLRSVHNAHRYSDGFLLHTAPAASLKTAYKSPIWNISRYQLARILLERAKALGVICKFDTTVQHVDTVAEMPSIVADTETYHFDLVIAADGIRSQIRSKILGHNVQPNCSLTAYSVNVSRDLLASDPELEFLLHRSGFWQGPGRSVNQMDMPDFENSCNFCFSSQSKKGTEGEWDTMCDVEEVKAEFADFDPRLHKVLSLVDGACYLWKLSDIPVLRTWQSANKRVVLLGDAAHAMLPFAAMGAASGIEDSLCLAECLDQIDDIPTALDRYENIRKPRTSFIQEVGRQNMRMTLLPDGPEQEARDEAFKRNSANPTPQTSPPEAVVEQKMKNFDPPAVMTNAFAPTTRAYLMSYDVLAHTRAYLKGVA